MSQIEYREVIRDDYNLKHYESICKDGTMLIYGYGSGRFLAREEAGEVLKSLKEFQLKWRSNLEFTEGE